MSDIYLGLALLFLSSAVMFLVTVVLARRSKRSMNVILLLLSVSAIFVYLRFGWQSPYLARVLPFSNLIIVGNWFPLVSSLLGGLAWRLIPGSIARKCFWMAALGAAVVINTVHPLLGTPPRCGTCMRGKLCVQTTKQTCAPASAATLLQWHGIAASEHEMADLCLTRNGTSWLGLYRGLKVKTAKTRWDVAVCQAGPGQLPELRQCPMVLIVGWEGVSNGDFDYRIEEGWMPGVGHAVVLLGIREDGLVEIADPALANGRDTWTVGQLRTLWRGIAMRLIPRRARMSDSEIAETPHPI